LELVTVEDSSVVVMKGSLFVNQGTLTIDRGSITVRLTTTFTCLEACFDWFGNALCSYVEFLIY